MINIEFLANASEVSVKYKKFISLFLYATIIVQKANFSPIAK